MATENRPREGTRDWRVIALARERERDAARDEVRTLCRLLIELRKIIILNTYKRKIDDALTHAARLVRK